MQVHFDPQGIKMFEICLVLVFVSFFICRQRLRQPSKLVPIFRISQTIDGGFGVKFIEIVDHCSGLELRVRESRTSDTSFNLVKTKLMILPLYEINHFIQTHSFN